MAVARSKHEDDPKAQLRPLAATPQLRTRGPNSLERCRPQPSAHRKSAARARARTPKPDFRLEMQQAKANLDDRWPLRSEAPIIYGAHRCSRASRGGGVSSTASAAALASHDGRGSPRARRRFPATPALPVVRSPGKGLAAGSGAAAAAAVNAAPPPAPPPSPSSDAATTPPRPRGRPADSVPQPRGHRPFPEERRSSCSRRQGRSPAAADAAATPAAPAAAPSPAQPRATRGERRGSSSSDAAAGARARAAAAHDGRLRRDAARARRSARSGVTPPTGQADRRAARGGAAALLVEQRDLEQAADSDHGAGGGGGDARMGRSAGPRAACPRQQLLRRLGSAAAREAGLLPDRLERAQQMQEVGADADDVGTGRPRFLSFR